MAKLPLAPLAVYRLIRELRAARDDRPLAVGGARELAAVLRRDLSRGAVPGTVVDAVAPERAAALVYVLAGRPGDDDERVLRAAHAERVPIVCVLADPSTAARIPYVLATDVVRVPPGSGFPLDEIGRALAHRLGEKGSSLAARIPVLRRPVAAELVEHASRRNALLGAAFFVPGADLPALTLNQVRLVLGLAAAHGLELDKERLPEIVIVVGGGISLRLVARRLRSVFPFGRIALQGGVAYGGTRAIGEAALRLYEARTAASDRAMRRPASASPGAS